MVERLDVTFIRIVSDSVATLHQSFSFFGPYIQVVSVLCFFYLPLLIPYDLLHAVSYLSLLQ